MIPSNEWGIPDYNYCQVRKSTRLLFSGLVALVWQALVAVSVGSSVLVAQDFFLLLARCFFLLVVSSDVMSPR